MPALYAKVSGVHEAIIQPWVKLSSTWEPLINIWAKQGGVWNLVWTAFTATAAPLTASGVGFTDSINSSNSITATPDGGVGPFTYAWTKVSGDNITAIASVSATTFFNAAGMVEDELRTAVFKCTVTDTVTGVTADTNTVTVDIARVS